MLAAGARAWQASFFGASAPPDDKALLAQLPDLTEALTTLDILIGEDSGLGTSTRGKRLDAQELQMVRDALGRAIAEGFSALDRRPGTGRSLTLAAFVDRLTPDDVLITTNWDVLLDRALRRRFGVGRDTYGTAIELYDTPSDGPRPPLLKLHGSLNWLECNRCRRLYVNPILIIGDL